MTSQRIDLAIEGRATADGRMLLTDALHWADEPVPVTMNVAHTPEYSVPQVVGTARDFQRSDEGFISAEVQVEGRWLDQCSVQISVVDIQGAPDAISSARLVNVHLMPGPTNAWPELDKRLETT